jgi:hypothetical protein
VAVDPIILSLSIHGRIYCGLGAEEALMVAEKTVEVAGVDADVVDLLDAFDDVWAASLTAGVISEKQTTPVHPLDDKTHALNFAVDDEHRANIERDFEGFVDKQKRPARYKDKRFVAKRKIRKLKRRRWES